MDTESKALLEAILKKNPEELTADEKGFLNARSTYLNHEQRRIFASVLSPDALNAKVENATPPSTDPTREPTTYTEPEPPATLVTEEVAPTGEEKKAEENTAGTEDNQYSDAGSKDPDATQA